MYANEETIKVEENSKLKSLKKVKIWKNEVLNKAVIWIKNNKFLISTLGAFILFSAINAMMICTFFKIMQQYLN